MNRMLTDRLFCFSEDEFIILADACGVHSIYGFDMKTLEFKEDNESRYIRSIVNLYKKNVLRPQENKLQLTMKSKKSSDVLEMPDIY